MSCSELEVFKQAEWVEPHNRFVFWSGGKDSTVALHLALRAWGDLNPSVVFVDTGITFPETLEYVKNVTELWKLNLVTLKPKIDFWDYVAKNGFPILKALWCRRLLKMTPIRKFLKTQHGWKVQVLGIRQAESALRATAWYYQKSFMRHRKLPFIYELLPILKWSDNQVEKYVRRFKIPVNPSYKKYGTSGCYFCPFVTNSQHYLILKRNRPKLFQKIVEAEKIRRGKTAWFKKSVRPIAEQQFLEGFEL